jgi:hypothetical protein
VVRTIDPTTGTVRSRPLGERIANSFAVEDTGAIYLVADAAMYRLEADNADPTNVLVYRRGDGARVCRQPVCRQPVFAKAIGTSRSFWPHTNSDSC